MTTQKTQFMFRDMFKSIYTTSAIQILDTLYFNLVPIYAYYVYFSATMQQICRLDDLGQMYF